MRLRAINDEVVVAEGSPVQLGDWEMTELKERARDAPRKRIRICAHSRTEDMLHEMLIVHAADAYVRPHKHAGKSESMHVVEGEAEAVFLDDDGEISEVVPLGPYGSGRRFYYRLAEPVFHTLLFESEFLVMHEVTNGPFRREDTIFAPWAPEEEDADQTAAYRAELAERVRRWRG
jgi:cupin fold WbuC family metalloprotein